VKKLPCVLCICDAVEGLWRHPWLQPFWILPKIIIARTKLCWSDNFCPHRVIVIAIVTRPKRVWPISLKLNLTGVQCRLWGNETILILTDSWRPILRCYYDFVQWLILWEHEVVQLVLRKSFVCHPFIKSLCQNGSPNDICAYIRANFETCRAEKVSKSGQMTPSFPLYYTGCGPWSATFPNMI